MMSGGRSRLPFTVIQWQELEHQALIYKYMVSGMPVPPDLLYSIRRSLDSSLSSKLLLHQPQHYGWNYFQMGFGKKIDPEPGRCRRTDGKKWRCSKEAYPDSKYCERHMHRGRNRSRKPVEVTTPPQKAIPFSPITNTSGGGGGGGGGGLSPTTPTSLPFSYLSAATQPSSEFHHPFLYPFPSSAARPDQDHTANFLLDSGAYSRNGYGHGMKEEVDEHVFFSSDTSRTMRSGSGSLDDTSWQVAPLTMASPTLAQLKQHKTYVSATPQFHEGLAAADNGKNNTDSMHHHMKLGSSEEQHHQQQQPKKVMHHFFDEWPQETKHSWLDDSGDKYSTHAPLFKTHLSISIPNSPHDFFMAHNEK
ncbi:PREDICTED: growth-regulating factor 1-like [Ipomoea nil]|uniref:growth-regulating factor 1-like n=1 Tax=Ipomoea nil TaxID=35883 RepID=UPI0009008F24|nr:PREDICTED: growth-regulating factor 1-like [Ipomoea nil]